MVDIHNGPCIYYSGDIGVFGDMALIREFYRLDVAILSVGGKHNMGVREGACAAGLLHADHVIPMHHGTFPNQHLDMKRLAADMAVRAPRSHLVRLATGETFSCDS